MRQATESEVTAAWKRLDTLLAVTPLPRQDGTLWPAKVDDFMFMGIGDRGEFQFKHINTRNYVFITATGELEVPKTDKAFLRGFFDND